MSRRVLLLEEGWNQTSLVARALEAAGHDVTVLTASVQRARHRRRTVAWHAAPPIASAGFLPRVEQWMAAADFDHVVPLCEPAMYRLWDAEPAWAARIHPHAAGWQRALLRDKHALVEYMASRGVAVPRHVRLRGRVDVDAAVAALGLPLVVKDATGSAGDRVRIVESRRALDDVVARARALGGGWALQQWIPGPTYLLGGLFHEGRPLRLYAAEKLEQHPVRTGPAIRLRSSADDALVAAGTRVVRELRWTGFASVDLVRDARGRYLLLEVNPRPWGSIAGAAAAGVELFAPFVELLVGRVPDAKLGFAAGKECFVFPRYLRSPGYRTPTGLLRAARDLFTEQGRDWRHPWYALHDVLRFLAMRRAAPRL